MKSTLVCLLLSFLFTNPLMAQDCDELANNLSWDFRLVPDQIFPGDEFFVECYVSNFVDIIGFQYTFKFNSDVIEFQSVNDIGSPLIGAVGINTDPLVLASGNIPTLWTSSNATGQTIPDGPIYKIFFEAIGNPSDCFDWDINSDLTNIEIAFELDDGTSCNQTSINFEFAPEDQCLQCTNEIFAQYISCPETIQFYACGGMEPYTYQLNGFNGEMESGMFNSSDTISLTNLQSDFYTLNITDSDGLVSSIGDTIINVFDTEVSFDLSEQTVCNDASIANPSALDLDAFITSNRPYTILDPTGEVLNSSVVDFLGQEIGTYEYSFVVEGPHPCEDETYTLTITVLNCECPTIGLTPLGHFCQFETINFNDFLVSESQAGSFSILDENGNNIPVENSEGFIVSLILEGGDYTLVYQLDNPIPGCPDIVESSFTVQQIVQFSSGYSINICNSDTLENITTINLDTIDVSTTGFWWGPDGNPLDSLFLDFNGQPEGPVFYTFIEDNPIPPCDAFAATATLTINIEECISTSTLEIQPEHISIFPNPNSGEFTIALENSVQAKIFDLNGRVKMELSLMSGVNRVLSEGLTGGVYMIAISREGEIVGSQKLVVLH